MTKATIKRYNELLERNVITRTEVTAVTTMMRDLDRQYYMANRYDDKSVDAEKAIIVESIKTKVNTFGYSLTDEQTTMGIKWLKSYMFKKNGEPRQQKENPFEDNHRDIVNNFSHFTLVGFEDVDHYGNIGWYRPIYRVVDQSGRAFDYVPNVPFNGAPIISVSRVFNDDKRGIA